MKKYTLEYWEAKNGEWFYHIRVGGNIILDCAETYSTKSNCLRAIKRNKVLNLDLCKIVEL
jgi:uncharacterized protein YegP (UPF0339 family)